MRVLVIDERARAQVERVKEYAEEHHFIPELA